MRYKNRFFTNDRHGFTLIELLFTIIIITTLCTLSASPLKALFTQYHQSTDAQRLFHVLQFARAEAIKRQQNIAICPSQDLKQCNEDWTGGYIVFMTKTPKETPSADAILRVQKISSTTQIYTPSLYRIEYTPEGRCLSRGSLYVIAQGQTKQRIVMYDSGRVRVEEVHGT
jgi:type IV fimbrial biogenesis protein FimT